MRKLALAFGVGLVATLAIAQTAPQPASTRVDRFIDQTNAIKMLNGSEALLGNIGSPDGGSRNNWTTTTPFDAGLGSMLKVQCVIPVRTQNGNSTTAATATSAYAAALPTDRYTWLMSTQNALAVMPDVTDGGTWSSMCNVYRMQ